MSIRINITKRGIDRESKIIWKIIHRSTLILWLVMLISIPFVLNISETLNNILFYIIMVVSIIFLGVHVYYITR